MRAVVLAEARRRAGRWRVAVVLAPRRARHLERAGRVVDEHAPRDELLAVEDRVAVQHGRDGDAQLRGALDDLVGRVTCRPRVDGFVPLRPVLLAADKGRELVVAEQVGAFDEIEEASNWARLLVQNPA